MNEFYEKSSVGYGHFSQDKYFSMSDPPHLIKKLHNNIYRSCFKENQ